jgi:predicted transporter
MGSNATIAVTALAIAGLVAFCYALAVTFAAGMSSSAEESRKAEYLGCNVALVGVALLATAILIWRLS